MASIFMLFSLLLSLLIRLAVERRPASAFSENFLLITLWQAGLAFWGNAWISWVFLAGIATWQTQNEYRDTTRKCKSERTELSCTALSRSVQFPAKKRFDQKGETNTDVQNSSPSCRGTCEPQIEKKLHGRVTMFPCDLRHLRRSGFKDDYHHSYLYVGCPVGLSVCHSPLIHIQPQKSCKALFPSKRAWFGVRPEDHAFNGGSNMTLAEKLEEFLLSEVSSNKAIQHTTH